MLHISCFLALNPAIILKILLRSYKFHSDLVNLTCGLKNLQFELNLPKMQTWVVSKSIYLSGNLNGERLFYKPVEDEFLKKFSCLAVGNVTFKTEARLNSAVAVTCNYCTERRFNFREKRVETYQVPLTVFQIKSSPPPATLQVYRITPIWFPINNLAETLEFSFENLENAQEVKDNCSIMMTVFFK